jgi:ribonuclease P protein component
LRLRQAAAKRCFPKTHRLLRPAEFELVIKTGQRLQDNYFTVYAAPSPLGHARLGLIVGRRVSNKSTVRNRIKRCVRESFRHEQDLLAGYDIVVAARAAATQAAPKQLYSALTKHWKRIAQQCKKS